MKKLAIVLFLGISIFVTDLYASTVNGISSFTVGGDDMTGMKIGVMFDGATIYDEAIWGTVSGNTGGASGAGWSLSLTGDNTFGDYWRFSSERAVSAIYIDAYNASYNSGAGALVFFDIFDWYYDDDTDTNFADTTGSFRGWWDGNKESDPDTNLSKGTTSAYSWEFSNGISVTPNDPEGDLWGRLDISFLQAAAFSDSAFEFRLDTDRSSDLDPPEVPEPSTMILFGLGLLGFGALGRKKQA